MVSVLHRFGGAAVKNTTFVTIRAANEKQDVKSNVLLFIEDGTTKATAKWNSEKHLVIHYEVYPLVQITNWNNIQITYTKD